jgi:hypothetical protein
LGKIPGLSSAEDAEEEVQYYVNHPDEIIPGGESLNQLGQRAEDVLIPAIYEGDSGLPPILVSHHSIECQVGRIFNNDKDSVLTKTGGVVGIFKTSDGYLAVPIFKAEKEKA